MLLVLSKTHWFGIVNVTVMYQKKIRFIIMWHRNRWLWRIVSCFFSCWLFYEYRIKRYKKIRRLYWNMCLIRIIWSWLNRKLSRMKMMITWFRYLRCWVITCWSVWGRILMLCLGINTVITRRKIGKVTWWMVRMSSSEMGWTKV